MTSQLLRELDEQERALHELAQAVEEQARNERFGIRCLAASLAFAAAAAAYACINTRMHGDDESPAGTSPMATTAQSVEKDHPGQQAQP